MRIDKDILRICIKSHGTITPTISSTGPIEVTLGAALGAAAELVEGRVDFLILVLKIWNDSGNSTYTWLVVSTHLKNISQSGNLPQIGVKIKKCWNHQPDTLPETHIFAPENGWMISFAFGMTSW